MNIHIYNIYVQYGKCDFFLYELLKQVEQWVFFVYFAGSVHTFYIYQQCIFCLFCYVNKFKINSNNCLKRTETSVVLLVFNGVFNDVRAYTVTVSDRSLYMHPVPEHLYFEQWTYITKTYAINASLLSHICQ